MSTRKPHTHIVRQVQSVDPARQRPARRRTKAANTGIQDVLADNYVLLSAAVLGEAFRDAQRRWGVSKRDQTSAQLFLQHSALADSMAGVCECEFDLATRVQRGRLPSVTMPQLVGYFVELPDSADGHRHHTNDRPVVIRGCLTPLRPGAGEVIVVEQPADLAVAVRAVPAKNWVQVEARVAGAITEREYARLLARVPGIERRYVTAARQRAMGPSKLAKVKVEKKRSAKSSSGSVVAVVEL